MPPGINAWVEQGKGRSPRISWTTTTDAPLVAMRLARETGELLAADETGALYRIDPLGRIVSVTRAKSPIRRLVWSDTGNGGAMLVGDRTLYWFNEQLQFTGSMELVFRGVGLAIEAHGNYTSVSLGDTTNLIFDSNRKLLRYFSTSQPLSRLEFLLSQPALIGIAEYGLLCCVDFNGQPQWQEKLFGGVGDLAIQGVDEAILLASYALGIQCHDLEGQQDGSYQVGGTARQVAASLHASRIAVATQEGAILWMNTSGQVLWSGQSPEELLSLACEAQGRGLICGFRSGRISRIDWA